MTNNQIKAIVERIEKLEEEKANIAEDIKDRKSTRLNSSHT